MTGLSIGMIVKDDKWSDADQDGQTVYKRSSISADLYEVSPVAFPAYPAAEVNCRSLAEYKVNTATGLRRQILALELELLDL